MLTLKSIDRALIGKRAGDWLQNHVEWQGSWNFGALKHAISIRHGAVVCNVRSRRKHDGRWDVHMGYANKASVRLAT